MRSFDWGYLLAVPMGLLAVFLSQGLAEFSHSFYGPFKAWIPVWFVRWVYIAGGVALAVFGIIGFLEPLWR